MPGYFGKDDRRRIAIATKRMEQLPLADPETGGVGNLPTPRNLQRIRMFEPTAPSNTAVVAGVTYYLGSLLRWDVPMGLYKPVFGGGSQAGTPTVAVFFDDETVPEDAQEFDCIAWGEVTGGDTGQPSFGSAAYPSFTPFAGGGKVQCPVLRVTGTLTVVRLIAYYSALIETWSVGDGGWQDPDPLKGPPAVALFQKANAPLTSDGTGIYMSWDTLQTIGVAGSTYKVWCTPERPC